MGTLIDIPSAKGPVKAYMAQPTGECLGGILVIHEVWGLADHIKDVAERFAKQGYLAVAPDFLSGTIDIAAVSGLQNDLFNPEKRNTAQPKLRALMSPMQNPEFAATTQKSLADCFEYLYEMPQVKNRVSIVGFCFGGTYSFSLAVHEPRLKLALPFYGHADFSAQELANIKCPVRAFYGQKDENLIQSLPELKTKMQQANIDFESTVYPDCGHAFFNDTNPYAYNKPAATDAWQKTLDYLKEFADA